MKDVTAKFFDAILLKRFQSERDQRIRPNRSGFRPGHGCSAQLHNLCRTLEQRWRFQQATIMCYVDFASTLDSMYGYPIWRIMAVEAHRTVICVHQDEDYGKWGCLTFRYSTRMCIQIHYRLESCPSLARLPRCSG